MADWTTISNAALAIGAPSRASNKIALRENPIAIAEGAPDAPRLRPRALEGDAVAAGTARTVFDNPFNHVITSSQSITAPTAIAFAASVTQTGTIRLSFEHWRGPGGGSADVAVYRNETLVQTWSDGGGTPQTRTIAALAIEPGDRLMVTHSKGASPDHSTVRNITIQTSGGHLWLVPYGMVP